MLTQFRPQPFDWCSDVAFDDTGHAGAAVISKPNQGIIATHLGETSTKVVESLLLSDIAGEPQVPEALPLMEVKELLDVVQDVSTIDLQLRRGAAPLGRHLSEDTLYSGS